MRVFLWTMPERAREPLSLPFALLTPRATLWTGMKLLIAFLQLATRAPRSSLDLLMTTGCCVLHGGDADRLFALYSGCCASPTSSLSPSFPFFTSFSSFSFRPELLFYRA